MSWYGGFGGFAPRKSVAQRRAEAARAIERASRGGKPMAPVVLSGRTIASTFWGKAWCENLERYQDFAYRLERGRSYVRSGSVIDLTIGAGTIVAKVYGSSIYEVTIDVAAVARPAWRSIQRDCAGRIGSRLDLLSGKLAEPVMARLCAEGTGLFPPPSAIQFECSCPDFAIMCKHVAAVMYGVGARLDASPELLFTLRRVSPDELQAAALAQVPAAPRSRRVLAAGDLSSLFGIDLADPAAPRERTRTTKPRATKPRASKPRAKPQRSRRAASKKPRR